MRTQIPLHLAVEDELGERVIRRALSERNSDYHIKAVYTRGGYGGLKRQALAYNKAAKICPFLLLTDLDDYPCPSQLVGEWLAVPKHPRFLFRVAVREVESWLLGDARGLAKLFGLKGAHHIEDPESCLDPKQELLGLANISRHRSLREAMVWRDNRTGRLSQGPDYNGALADFVAKQWDVEGSRLVCQSLNRLYLALEKLEAELNPTN